MMQTSNYLFIYGTLLDSRNEFGAYLNRNCTFYSDGKFKGKLYNLGEYPGAIREPYELSYVYGKIFTVNDPNAVLIKLDDYEGFGPDQEQPNLFVRELIPIETENTIINCWVYLYNLPVNDSWLIESGKYL